MMQRYKRQEGVEGAEITFSFVWMPSTCRKKTQNVFERIKLTTKTHDRHKLHNVFKEAFVEITKDLLDKTSVRIFCMH